MKHHPRFVTFAALALAAVLAERPARAEPVDIEVFSDQRYPVFGIEAAGRRGARITLYDLGAPARLLEPLNAGLPGNLEEAKAATMARIHRIGLDEFKRRLREAYSGQLKAFEYRIRSYPAVVFDQGASVIYGVTDLPEALRCYRTWRASRNEP